MPEPAPPVIIGRDVLSLLPGYLKQLSLKEPLFIITDTNVLLLHLPKLLKILEAHSLKYHVCTIPAGEVSKNFNSAQVLINQILKYNPNRQSTIIAFGGGVVGDIAGFVASIILRGLNLVHIPTTLLAQVDSAIGGKTAINSEFGKNMIGSFYQAHCCLIDLTFLDSLPYREFIAGYAEIVKYAVIGDLAFFEFLVRNQDKIKQRDKKIIEACVTFSCKAKKSYVTKDLREEADRILLNFGHSFAHALEIATGFSNELLHGEAVAIGMCMALSYAHLNASCPAIMQQRLTSHLQFLDLPTSPLDIREIWDIDNLVNYMWMDKKKENNHLRLILSNEIGTAFVAPNIDQTQLHNFYVAFFNKTK